VRKIAIARHLRLDHQLRVEGRIFVEIVAGITDDPGWRAFKRLDAIVERLVYVAVDPELRLPAVDQR
jgi:hypothetical protein